MKDYLDYCQAECQRLENLIRAAHITVYSGDEFAMSAAQTVLDDALTNAEALCHRLDVVNRPAPGEAA